MHAEHAVSFEGLDGDYVLILVSPTRIVFDANSNGKSVVVNGVPYTARLGLAINEDGTVYFDDEAQYPDHTQSRKWIDGHHNRDAYKDATLPARQKLRKLVIPAVQQWLNEHPYEVAQANYDAAYREVQRLAVRQEEIRREISKLEGDRLAVKSDTVHANAKLHLAFVALEAERQKLVEA